MYGIIIYLGVNFCIVFNCDCFFFYFRMKKKYYLWDECFNLREVKVE